MILSIILMVIWTISAIILLKKPKEYSLENWVVALMSVTIVLHLLSDILKEM